MATKLFTKEFLMITFSNFFLACSFQMLIPTLPIYVSSLGAVPGIVGLLAGALTVSALIMRPFGGILLDRVGRREVFRLSLLALAILTFVCIFQTDYRWVIAVRFLYGFGWGVCSTAASTIAADTIPRIRFGEGMGYFSLSISLAIAIAPAIAIALYDYFGFSTVILVATGLLVTAFILSFFVYNKPIDEEAKQKKLPFPYEKSAIRPAFLIFFVAGSMGAITNFIAIYALEEGIGGVSLFFVVYAAALLITRPASGKMIDSRGLQSVVIPSFVLMILSFILISYASNLVHLCIAAALFGTGFGGASTAFQTMSVLNAPHNRIGAANATYFTGFDGGIGVCAILAGVIAGYLGYSAMYMIFAGIVALAMIFYLIFGKNMEHKTHIQS